MKNLRTHVFIATLLLAGASSGVNAQIVKCIGKDGRVEFANVCPPGSQQHATSVSGKAETRPHAPAVTKDGAKDAGKDAKDKAAPKTLAERDAEFRKRLAEQKEAEEKAAKTSAREADRKRACESAQSNLQALKSRQRLFRIDPKTGERVFYEDADYKRELPIMERNAAEFCKS